MYYMWFIYLFLRPWENILLFFRQNRNNTDLGQTVSRESDIHISGEYMSVEGEKRS